MRPLGDRLRSAPVRRVARASLIVIVAAAAAWAYEWTSFARDMERTTGEIVEMTRTPFSRVPVAFDPANPAEARLGDFFHVYPVFGTLLAFMGIMMLVVVVLVVRG